MRHVEWKEATCGNQSDKKNVQIALDEDGIYLHKHTRKRTGFHTFYTPTSQPSTIE